MVQDIDWNDEQLELGEVIAIQPKADHSWLAFGLGIFSGFCTSAAYTGFAAAIGVGAPVALTVGIGFTLASAYLTMPEEMSYTDYAVLGGGILAAEILGIGTTIYGLKAVGYAAGVFGVSYAMDTNGVLQQTAPTTVGIVVGGVAGGFILPKIKEANEALEGEYGVMHQSREDSLKPQYTSEHANAAQGQFPINYNAGDVQGTMRYNTNSAGSFFQQLADYDNEAFGRPMLGAGGHVNPGFVVQPGNNAVLAGEEFAPNAYGFMDYLQGAIDWVFGG